MHLLKYVDPTDVESTSAKVAGLTCSGQFVATYARAWVLKSSNLCSDCAWCGIPVMCGLPGRLQCMWEQGRSTVCPCGGRQAGPPVSSSVACLASKVGNTLGLAVRWQPAQVRALVVAQCRSSQPTCVRVVRLHAMLLAQ